MLSKEEIAFFIMEDASSDVPNPMGEKVTVVLTGGNKYGEEES